MARRTTPLPLVAALLILGACKGGATSPAAAASSTPTPAAPAAAPAAPAIAPGQSAAAPSGAAMPGMPPAAAAPPFDVAKLPAVVARVNGQDVKKQELLARADAMRQQMRRMGGGTPPQSAEFYHAMLDQIIGSRLLFAEAKKKGDLPTPAELQQRVEAVKSRFPDPATYQKQLAAQGMSEQQMQNDIQQTLAIQKLISTDVAPNVKVTDETAKAFYQANLDQMKRPPAVRVRHVLVAVPQNATAEQRQAAKKKAEGLLARVKKGEDLAAVAREASDDPSKSDGGLLPWMSQGQTVPAFEKAAFALKTGETSGIVETMFGYHILRVEDRRPASTVPFEEAKPQIEQMLQQRQAGQLLEQKVNGLRKAAKVEVLF